MRFPDREETYEAGDAFYTPPGHTPMLYEGSEILWFHPTDEMAKTMEVMRNGCRRGAQVLSLI